MITFFITKGLLLGVLGRFFSQKKYNHYTPYMSNVTNL